MLLPSLYSFGNDFEPPKSRVTLLTQVLRTEIKSLPRLFFFLHPTCNPSEVIVNAFVSRSQGRSLTNDQGDWL